MSKKEEQTERYKYFNYEITGDPDFMHDKYGITPEIQQILQDVYPEVIDKKRGIIEKLTKLAIKYPNVPHFKNHLSCAHNNLGNRKKAFEVNEWIIKEHPDYLFGKLNKASRLIDEERYDEIPRVLSDLMDIQDLYPERNVFHINEVLSFNKIAVMYFLATGNMEVAESRYAIMKELDSEHDDTLFAQEKLMYADIKIGLERFKEKYKNLRTVKSIEHNKSIQTQEAPEFVHPQIEELYRNDMRIDHSIISEILSLPRETLIKDLESVLEDSIKRYEYFKNRNEKEVGLEFEETDFVIHALFLLSELKAHESLPVFLELLRQGEELLEFWFGDLITEELWDVIYHLGYENLQMLKEFLFEPNLYTYSRVIIPEGIAQIAIHRPEKKKEIIEWFKEIFEFFLDNKDNDDIIDSELIALMVGDILDFRWEELLDLIEQLFANEMVSVFMIGDFNEVKEEMNIPAKDIYQHKVFDIYSRYNNIVETWDDYVEEEDVITDDDFDPEDFNNPILPIEKTKIGRNEPCYCGSGKKYKRCCWLQDNN